MRPVHGQRLARRDAARVGRAEDQGVEAPHLLVQEPHRVGRLVRAEAVGADELRQPFARVRRREARRPHLVEAHRHAPAGQLPGGLAARQTTADDAHGHAHGAPEDSSAQEDHPGPLARDPA